MRKKMKIDASLMFDPLRNGEMAAELEELGFDGVYSFEGQHDAFMSLATAASNTRRMDLMTSVAIAFARNPMNIAYLANDLQMMSAGRFVLGLGTQVKAHVERRFSMPWSRPAARMRETVHAIRAIWDSWENGERLKFEGEFYNHTLMPPTFSPGKNAHGAPPIYIAGVGPLMTQVAAEVGDGYFVHPFHTRESFDKLSKPALTRGLEKSGRTWKDLTVSAQVVTATGENEESLEKALFSARSQIAFYASTPAYKPVLEVHGWDDLQPRLQSMSREGKWLEMAGLINDEMLHAFAVIGSVQEVAQQLVERCGEDMDRISPVIYQPDTALLGNLASAIRNAHTS
jgi:probable F420-dependent oxidoreductase